MEYDSRIENILEAAYAEKRDIFLSIEKAGAEIFTAGKIRTLVLLPGAFESCGEFFFSDYKKGFALPSQDKDLVYADVRFMADENFRVYLTEKGFSRIVFLCAELIDLSEYGCRTGYGWISEYKAERKDFVQAVGLFTLFCPSSFAQAELYGFRRPVFAGEQVLPELRIIKTDNMKAKFYMLAAEAEKHSGRKASVFFTSRGEAESFGAFLYKRGTPYALYTGEKQVRFGEYIKGEINLLLATKSFIPASLFLPEADIIFCGVPFSLSHLVRCCIKNKGCSAKLIYCKEDYQKNEKISLSFSAEAGGTEIAENRHRSLVEIKKYLTGKEKV